MAEQESRVIFVYTVCASDDEAARIAATLLEERLIACGNWWPINSTYRWKGKIEKGTEIVLILKTDNAHVEAVEEKVKGLHSYEVPCIGRLPLSSVNETYQGWLEGELAS
ncbi:MAG: divalent-cation tolerance protein CutA [bacterium]|nr:divalent-cation tolerance protein CutA [bacterium]